VNQPTRRRPLLADVVRADLAGAILNGEFPLGSKLPNEQQLCDRFDVSRITLREAVQGLIQDGYVIRRQGSGTYVTRRPSLKNSLDTNFSYTEYLENSGIRAGRKLIGAQRVAADQETAEALSVERETPLIEVRRVRTADGHPAIYSIDYLPADIVDLTRDRDALDGSLYRLLTRLSHPVDHGEAIVAPAIADAKLAKQLGVTKGTLLQHLKQVDFDTRERAVMLSLEWHVPSVIELRVYRRGPGPVASTSN
jgi:DNA-binding GntR family transcriptional regulator